MSDWQESTPFTIGLAQTRQPNKDNGTQNVVELVGRFATMAAEKNVDLLVFPESLMTPYGLPHGEFARRAEAVGGPFSTAVERIAADCKLWMVYTMNEASTESPASENGKPFNTAVIVDSEGRRRGIYRKTHLFDTDSARESDCMGAGDALFNPIETPFGKLGIAICYDLRFPEVARYAALRGCQLMLYPAAWVDGELKAQQWRTLLAARAIENQMYVAGICRPDAGCIGQSCVIDPRGEIIAQGASDEELITCRIDVGAIASARANMPVLQHRRPELYC